MMETRHGQLKSARCSAGLRLGFVDINVQTGLGEDNSRRQAIGA